jgi:hypothetical protein
MNKTKLTKRIMITSIVLLIAYDLLPAFLWEEKGDTISEIKAHWSYRWWILPAGWGVLMGHFFSPFSWRSHWVLSLILLVYGLLVLFVNVLGGVQLNHPLQVFVVFMIHVAVGALCWSQGITPPKKEES